MSASHLCEGKLLGVGEVGALGQHVVRGGGASEGLQQLRQIRGGARTSKGTFRRGQCSRMQLLHNAFTQSGQFPAAKLLFNNRQTHLTWNGL